MQLNNFVLSKSIILKILYIALFYIFVTPYSVAIANQGVSANYLFVFFPLIVLCIKKEISWPPRSVLIFIAILSFIYLYGAISQVEQYDLILRRSASFLVFMSVFSFMFVKIDSDMIQSFMVALIIFSLYEACKVIIVYISIDGNNIGGYAKGLVGTQRIAFVYLMAFWLIIMANPQTYMLKFFKFLAAYMVITAIFLTFSRSSILGLLVSFGAYFLHIVIISFKNKQTIISASLKVFSKTFYIMILIVLVAVFFDGPVKYYLKTMVGPVVSKKINYFLVDDLTKGNVSDSKIDLMKAIIAKVKKSKEIRIIEQNFINAKVALAEKIDIEAEMQHQVEIRLKNLERIEDSQNFNEKDDANKIYLEYIGKNEVTHKAMLEANWLVDNIKILKDIALNKLYVIELKKLLLDTQMKLEMTKERESIDKIKRKLYDIDYQLIFLREESVINETNLNELNSLKSNVVMLRLKDDTSSIGYRFSMHKKVFSKTLENPLTGSAFLGVWSMFENREGSAHSQYLDILFRVGVVAFIAYLFFLYKITRFLYIKEVGLFFGFISFLAIGTFHETIKLSQGGFIFSFLFAMWAQQKYSLKNNEKSN